MCSRPKAPPAPPPPPQLPPAPPPPEPSIKMMSEETGQTRAGRQAEPGMGGVENVFAYLTQRRGKRALTIPRA
jgi:hypothetical protein